MYVRAYIVILLFANIILLVGWGTAADLRINNMNKRILWLAAVLSMIFVCTVNVSADTISDAKKEKKATESKLNALNESIDDIEEAKESMEEEAMLYQQELVDLIVSIQIINGDIENKEAEIATTRAELEAAIAKQQSQKYAMNKRIKYMYEKGDSSYLQLLLDARKYADAVNKSTYSEKLYAYDRYQLYLYEQTKLDVIEKKQELEEDLEELEEVKADATDQEQELQDLIDEYSKTIEDFEQELDAAKKKASEFKNQIQKQSESIKQMEAEERRKAEEAARKKAEEEARRKAEEEARRKAIEEEERQRREKEEQAEESDESDDNRSDSSDEKKESSEKSEEKESQKVDDGSASESSSSSGSSSGSSKGSDIANFACQFIGNPYVAGGTSLTNGADCSGFTQAVYSNFGISLPRTSGSQALCGTSVSYAEAQPGDIIYYGGHVGIYIGNGQIVHASTQSTGIKISSALYRSIISVRRIV